jgi:hypothetical protein
MDVTPDEPESLAAKNVRDTDNMVGDDIDDEDECRVCRGPAEEG